MPLVRRDSTGRVEFVQDWMGHPGFPQALQKVKALVVPFNHSCYVLCLLTRAEGDAKKFKAVHNGHSAFSQVDGCVSLLPVSRSQ